MKDIYRQTLSNRPGAAAVNGSFEETILIERTSGGAGCRLPRAGEPRFAAYDRSWTLAADRERRLLGRNFSRLYACD